MVFQPHPLCPLLNGKQNDSFAETVHTFTQGVVKAHFAPHTISDIPEEMRPNVFKADANWRRKHDLDALKRRFGVNVAEPDESTGQVFPQDVACSIAGQLQYLREALVKKYEAAMQPHDQQSYYRIVNATESVATVYRYLRESYGIWLHPCP